MQGACRIPFLAQSCQKACQQTVAGTGGSLYRTGGGIHHEMIFAPQKGSAAAPHRKQDVFGALFLQGTADLFRPVGVSLCSQKGGGFVDVGFYKVGARLQRQPQRFAVGIHHRKDPVGRGLDQLFQYRFFQPCRNTSAQGQNVPFAKLADLLGQLHQLQRSDDRSRGVDLGLLLRPEL